MLWKVKKRSIQCHKTTNYFEVLLYCEWKVSVINWIRVRLQKRYLDGAITATIYNGATRSITFLAHRVRNNAISSKTISESLKLICGTTIFFIGLSVAILNRTCYSGRRRPLSRQRFRTSRGKIARGSIRIKNPRDVREISLFFLGFFGLETRLVRLRLSNRIGNLSTPLKIFIAFVRPEVSFYYSSHRRAFRIADFNPRRKRKFPVSILFTIVTIFTFENNATNRTRCCLRAPTFGSRITLPRRIQLITTRPFRRTCNAYFRTTLKAFTVGSTTGRSEDREKHL